MKDRIEKIYRKEEEIDKKIREIEKVLRSDIDEKVKMSTVRAIVEELKKELVENHYSALTDDLTGFFNKKAVVEIFNKKLLEVASKGTNLSFVVIDIDKLKHFNDTYGHLAGTELIRGVSNAITASIRKSDIASRYGGDEFLLVCVHTKPEDIKKVIDRIYNNVAKVETGVAAAASVSTGYATMKDGVTTFKQLFSLADKMVYEEKARKKTLRES